MDSNFSLSEVLLYIHNTVFSLNGFVFNHNDGYIFFCFIPSFKVINIQKKANKCLPGKEKRFLINSWFNNPTNSFIKHHVIDNATINLMFVISKLGYKNNLARYSTQSYEYLCLFFYLIIIVIIYLKLLNPNKQYVVICVR